MAKVDEVYEQYWGNKKSEEKFSGYERNWFLPKLLKHGEKVLDVGCGDGAVGEYLIQQWNCEVFGMDFSEAALKIAARRGLKVKKNDLQTKFPFPDKTFDMVFWGDNIEHLFSPDRAADEIYRVLKDNGRIIVSCPNMAYWRYRIEYFLTGMVPRTEWIEKNMWESQHIRFFNPNQLREFFEAHRFSPKRVVGVSRRRLDKPFLELAPELFGMIMIMEAAKNG